MQGRDHPGDFTNQVGWDLYLNPWWGVRRPQLNAAAQRLVTVLDTGLGAPDLWFNGTYHELLWGPRDVPSNWRPCFWIALSGGDGALYNHFWLPWRGGIDLSKTTETWPHIAYGHVLDEKINDLDLEGVRVYISVVNSRRLPEG